MRPKVLWIGLLVVSSLLIAAFFLFRSPRRAEVPKGADSDLEWFRSQYVEAYDQVGTRSSKWDVHARKALNDYVAHRARTNASGKRIMEEVGPSLKAAMEAGCTDPLIEYLYLRFSPPDSSRSGKELGDRYTGLVPRMQNSGYPALCKFYVSLRGSQVLKGLQKGTPPIVQEYRDAAIHYLAEVLEDRNLPLMELDAVLETVYTALSVNYAKLYSAYLVFGETLLQSRPNAIPGYLFKGRVHIKLAWAERGTEYADKVTEKGWEGFARNLEIAAEALEEAWALGPSDARVPIEMLTVELGQGKGRKRMEEWFSRAIALDPSSYEACRRKVYYLEPKWHGSAEEMLAFGRECVASPEWKGRIPLILVDVHEAIVRYIQDKDLRPGYWTSPGVWEDLHAAFERFFGLNPEEVSYRHNYAKYAYRCEQWEELARQLKQLGPVNYDYFGGRAEFEKMVRMAAEKTRNTPGPTSTKLLHGFLF